MTREQREKIANIAGRIWTLGEIEKKNALCQILQQTATVLNKILEDDLKAQEGELKAKIPYGATIDCNAEGKVDET